MDIQRFSSFRAYAVVGLLFLFSTVVFTAPAFATVINVTSNQLNLHTSVLGNTRHYSGSAFPETTLSNWGIEIQDFRTVVISPSEDVGPLSLMAWASFRTDMENDHLRMSGFALTDKEVGGNYEYWNQLTHFAYSEISLDMTFNVQGVGALLNSYSHGRGNVTVLDLTDGITFTGPELQDGHQYHLFASANMLNGGGNEQIFDVHIGPASIAVPEPTALVLIATGIAGLGFYRRRTKFKAR